MKRLGLVVALCLAAGSVSAGGTAEPVMAPEVVEAAASSANDSWAGIVLLVLFAGAALSAGGGNAVPVAMN